jgi:hypothetical protein
MDEFCDEPDSAELLMMQIDFPDDVSQMKELPQKTTLEGERYFFFKKLMKAYYLCSF